MRTRSAMGNGISAMRLCAMGLWAAGCGNAGALPPSARQAPPAPPRAEVVIASAEGASDKSAMDTLVEIEKTLRDEKSLVGSFEVVHTYRSGCKLVRLPSGVTGSDVVDLTKSGGRSAKISVDLANRSFQRGELRDRSEGLHAAAYTDALAAIHAEGAAVEIGSRAPVVVAVIDSGVAYNHPALQDNMWTNPLEVGSVPGDSDDNGYPDDIYGMAIPYGGDPMDPGEHGTMVAGTIAAQRPEQYNVTGIGGGLVRIMALRCFKHGAAELKDLLYCYDYVSLMKTRDDSPVNVRVINNSWADSPVESICMKRAIEEAGRSGILSVFAAGNGSANIDAPGRAFYPPSYNLDSMVSVAAAQVSLRAIGDLVVESNRGSTSVHLAAPGDGFHTLKPCKLTGCSTGNLDPSTSKAAPFVSGAAALLFAQCPNLSPSEARCRLIRTADTKSWSRPLPRALNVQALLRESCAMDCQSQ